MRQKPGTKQSHGGKVVEDIRRATRQGKKTAQRLGRLSFASHRPNARPRGVHRRNGGEDEPHPAPRLGTSRGAPDHGRSFGSWGTQTLIAGLSRDALIAPWVIKGAMNGPAVAAYIREVLVKEIAPGTVVILSSHGIAAQYD